MQESRESPFRAIKRQPFSSALALLMGALGGLMWALSGDRTQMPDVWMALLCAEAGAVIALASWIAVSSGLARMFGAELSRTRRGDALTYLPLLFSSLITLNLVFQAGGLNRLVFLLVTFMLIGAKIVEIIWLILLHKARWLSVCVPSLLALLLCAGLLRISWHTFAPKGEYWKDREVVRLSGDAAAGFEGGGAERVYANGLGRWRPSTKMAAPGVYRAKYHIAEPARLSLGFLADDHSVRKIRVSIGVNGKQLFDDKLETADGWKDRIWPIETGELEIRVSPESGIMFASDPVVTTAANRPNIIVVVIDTLRADHLGSYGYWRDTSPRIDALARKGILFENHYSTTSWSTAAVASLFTGLYPSQHGCVDFTGLYLPSQLDTFAEILKRAGYRTVAVSGNPLLSVKSGFAHGFDSFNEKCFGAIYYRGGECMTDQGIADTGGGQPELLFLQYFDPHAPYDAPPPEMGMYRGWPSEQPNPGAVMQFIINRYDEEIRYEDRQISRLLDYLKSTGWLNNAVIIITADHGEELADHGRVTHGYTVYEEVIHVPLIIVGPGALENRRVKGLTSSIDLLPTILAAAGVIAPPRTQGNNLLANPTPARPYVIADVLEQTALRTPQWKLIGDNKRRKEELYDMQSDPHELRDVAAQHPDTRLQLHRDMVAVIAELSKVKSPRPHARAIEIQFHRRLKALGYIQ